MIGLILMLSLPHCRLDIFSHFIVFWDANIMKKDLANNQNDTVKVLAGGLVRLRGHSDTLTQYVAAEMIPKSATKPLTVERQWWVASTVIPLVAATIGPLSSVLSIAALTSPWRVALPNEVVPSGSGRGTEDMAIGIRDPEWYVSSRHGSRARS